MARRLLGDPPRLGADEWRYGSLSVHPARGTWHDFEADAGGGALALIEHVNGCDKAGALAWLVDARLIDPPAGPGRTPAAPRRPGGTSPPHPRRPRPPWRRLHRNRTQWPTWPPPSWSPRCRLTTRRRLCAIIAPCLGKDRRHTCR